MSEFSARTATLERPMLLTWDYMVETIHARHDEILQDQLKEFGGEGWELVFVTVPVTCEYKCVFRRPR